MDLTNHTDLPRIRILTDSQLRIQKASAATSELTGYEQEDLVGLHLALFADETDRYRLFEAGAFAMIGLSQTVGVCLTTATGVPQKLIAEAQVVSHQGGRGILWSFTPEAEDVAEEMLSIPSGNSGL